MNVRMKQGAWHTEEKILFPGYVFLVSRRVTELYRSLRNVVGLAKLLSTGKEMKQKDSMEDHKGVKTWM